MQVTLFTIEGSNACRSTELLLDHAGVEWTRRGVLPVLHALELRMRGFDHSTAPAAIIDGERIQGSRQIARVVADALPQSGLLPADPELRERVLEAERSGERLQAAARRILYVLGQGDPRIVRPIIDANYRHVPSPVRGVLARGLVRAASAGHRARAGRIDGYLDRVAEVLDELDALVVEGVLGTDTPTVADFQAAPNLAALACAPALRSVIADRPSWQIAERIGPDYPVPLDLQVPEDWASRLERR